MKIIVYGMGIIGASFAAALKAAGHTVYGKNRSSAPLEIALERGMIDGVVSSYEGADVVILALPPKPTMRELDEGVFPENVIVTDICGVKGALEKLVFSKPRSYRYVGMHPMAGKEKSGIAVADVNLFKGKNLVITACDRTEPSALETVERLGIDAGFGRIVKCTADEHDAKIALTSQLAHIVSNAYIRSSQAKNIVGFTGGSFQDMTRVGGVDENLWTDLYFYNRESLLAETEGLISRLEQYCEALRQGDEEEMRRLLKEGRLAHAAHFSET